MAEPFLAEIRIFSFNFPPRGWAFCNGQLLAINQNQALFSLLGTTYGGNGTTTFALPNLQDRTPIHRNRAHPQGQAGGEAAHTLTNAEMPVHTHSLMAASANANSPIAVNNVLASANNLYRTAGNMTTLHPASIATAGGGQAHQNMQPYLTLNFCIALQGIFPSRN